jgi:hypothetical protein
VEAGRRAADELVVRQAGRDDLPPDGVGERDVAADVEAQPCVGPLRGAGPARVDRVQPGAVVDAAQDVMEEDRVRLARVRAPQDDEVRLLRLAVG